MGDVGTQRVKLHRIWTGESAKACYQGLECVDFCGPLRWAYQGHRILGETKIFVENGLDFIERLI